MAFYFSKSREFYASSPRYCWPSDSFVAKDSPEMADGKLEQFQVKNPVQNFFRTPLLAPKLGLHNQGSQLLRGLIGMTVRRAFQFRKSLQSMLIITSDPLIARRSANPIASAKLALAVISAQP